MSEAAATAGAGEAAPRVSVVIPTFQRAEALRGALEDLARQRDVCGEIVVVDQNSPPLASALYPARDGLVGALSLRVIRRPPGVVAARNAAVEASTGEILVFLDDDVRIDDPRFLHRHAMNYRDPGLAAVCGQELVPPRFETAPAMEERRWSPFEAAMFFPRNSTRRCEVGALSTCNCSIRKSVLGEMGGFAAAFGGNSYGDDADLVLRLVSKGARVVFDPAVSVRHLKWPRGGLRLGDRDNPFSEKEKYVSAWVFFFRHVPGRWKAWFLWHGILRKSLLLKANVRRPHRWPSVATGLVRSMIEGWRAAR